MRRGRYAPSPSGYMHIGNALVALLSWLQMRQCGGTFILRMEDIDTARCKPEFAEAIKEDLHWLGIDWDEGPGVGGPHAPYVQSDRIGLYEDALQRLLESGLLYPCTCTRAELMSIASAPHGLTSEGPAYPGICRSKNRKPDQIEVRFSLRFALPDEPFTFFDGVQGEQTFPPGAGGDFVVKRSDGVFGYQLAVVADDAAMGVTDVLRGGDLLDSTPRQAFLFRALGFPVPRYAHVPLLFGEDGRRLSKRHGSITLRELRENGVTSRRLAGCLAHWAGLVDRPESLSPEELIPLFRLDSIRRESIVFDEAKRTQLLACQSFSK